MAVTIDQVAAIAGVSRSTVSRALSMKKQRVSQATQERIRRIVQELGYMPSAPARRLASQSTATIGLYWNHGRVIGGGSLPLLMDGISEVLTEEGYNLLVALRGQAEEPAARMTSEKFVDGMIIAHNEDQVMRALFTRNGIPVVLAHSGLRDDCDCVAIDNAGAAGLCVDHLVKLGHRRIGYVNNCGTNRHVSEQTRAAGYVTAMAHQGLRVSPDSDRFMPTAERLDQLLACDEPPTALICYDDDAAMEVIGSLNARGLRTPQDVSIIGFNDSQYACFTTPSLTSVRLPLAEVGVRAARLLLERIENPHTPFRGESLQTELIERSSACPPREAQSR